VGYWGTIVVAWTPTLLVRQDGVAAFGYQHRWLRDLGTGWQMLETSGWNDPPDLAVAASGLAAATGAPVLAVYVCDSDCASFQLAWPGGGGSSAHIPWVGEVCQAYVHRPLPAGRAVDDVVADLLGWARAGGLVPSADAVRGIIAYADGQGARPAGAYRSAEDLVFDLVVALGVERIGQTRPYCFQIEEPPFSSIAGGFGLARMARSRAAFRDQGDDAADPVEQWEAAAIDLEQDLWAALYDQTADTAQLARRAAWVQAAYEACQEGAPPPRESRHDDTAVTHPHDVDRTLHDAHVLGRVQPAGRSTYRRELADQRATPDTGVDG
jgi:hypothetical protein